MNQYELRLSKVIEEKINVETKITNLLKIKGKKIALLEEKRKLVELIKDVQKKYLLRGKLETRIYENMLKSYSARLSEIEEQIAFVEAKEALENHGFNRVFKNKKLK
jgi:hypothetical protein